MTKHEHKAQYYETDQMGIIHHSNYIRWFEESRIEMLEEFGLGYVEMESKGIIIPVLKVNCEYKKMTYFGETVEIYPKLTAFKGARFSATYEVREKTTKELRCIGETQHCFLSPDGNILNLKKMFPEIYEVFMKNLD